MPLWPCQSDYPLRFLSTGQSVGYPEYESQSAPFGFPGTHGALTVVCMCVIQLKSSGLPISLVHVSRTTPPSKSRCYCVVPGKTREAKKCGKMLRRALSHEGT